MDAPQAVLSALEAYDQCLRLLDNVPLDGESFEEQQMQHDAQKLLTSLRCIKKRGQVERVAQLVRTQQWQEASLHFPDGGIGFVEEVLELLYDDCDLDVLSSAIAWTRGMQTKWQVKICQSIYWQFKSKGFTQQPHLLLLRSTVKTLDSVALLNELDAHFDGIVEQVVVGVQNKDYSFSTNIQQIQDQYGGAAEESVLNDVVVGVVQKVPPTLENTLLLIRFSAKLPRVENQCWLIDALWKVLLAKDLLDSEQALHLYAHAKYVKEEQDWTQVGPRVRQLCTDVLDSVPAWPALQHYLEACFNEDTPVDKLAKLHEQNEHLVSIVSEIVCRYYQPEEPSRVGTIIAAARATNNMQVVVRVLTQLHVEMSRWQQLDTYEAFRLFNAVRMYLVGEPLDCGTEAALLKLKAKTPQSVFFLLWSEQGNQVRLLNKFFNSPLCCEHEQVVCCHRHKQQQLCRAAVELRDAALTTFKFQDADADGKAPSVLVEPEDAAQVLPRDWNFIEWKIKHVNNHHVKIFTHDDKYLTTQGPWQNNSGRQAVCLKRENNTDMQLWTIEPANPTFNSDKVSYPDQKRIKIEIS